MNKILNMTVLAMAVAAFSTGAMAQGRGHGQDKAGKHMEKALKHERKAQQEYRKAREAQRYHSYQGRRYPVVVRDGRDYYSRDGRWYPVVWSDGRDRRYHPQSGKWDNGRRGPPSWAKGKDYRSYGYDRVVIVPRDDYRRYDLYQPRDGYRWMRDDSGRYILVQIASGIIADILMRRL